MAFSLNATLSNYEYRGSRSGTGSSGNPWFSLVLESPDDSRQLDVSVPNDLQGEVMGLGLHKGDKITLEVIAVSSEKYSFVRLVKVVGVVDSEGEVQF